MAIIKDLLGYIWKIDQTSQAGRITSYNTDGSVVKAIDGISKTYSASITDLTVANAGTDFFTISGSATKKIRIIEIELIGTATAASIQDIKVIKRSTLNEGGTSTSLTLIPHDSSDSAATAVVKAYTANPAALGTSTGQIMSPKILLSTVTTSPVGMKLLFGNSVAKSIVLNNANESICLNFNGATQAGNLLSISVKFIEE